VLGRRAAGFCRANHFHCRFVFAGFADFGAADFGAADFGAASRPLFSFTRNFAILVINASGSGFSRGNLMVLLDISYGASSSLKASNTPHGGGHDSEICAVYTE
jgi:hypothetical protein